MEMPVRDREPCPDRILDDAGGAFAMGAVGGSVFHFLKGLYHSPNGERLTGGVQAMRMNVPRVGGSFAVWGGLFSAFDCALVFTRQKDDPWNSIIAGAATGGLLHMRQGIRPVARSALGGGFILALIMGADIMFNHVLSQQNLQPLPDANPTDAADSATSTAMPPGYVPSPQQVAAEETSSSGGWFGGLFGQEEEGTAKNGSKTDFGCVDMPSVPIPLFEYK